MYGKFVATATLLAITVIVLKATLGKAERHTWFEHAEGD